MLLLTGATGFLGTYLRDAFRNHPGHKIILKRPENTEPEDPDYTYRTADILDPQSLLQAFEEVSVIVHAAGMVSYQPDAAELLMRVNAEGTANVVNMALEIGVRRVVYVSSVAALGRHSNGKVTTLKDKWPARRPSTPYAESKFAAEREIWRGSAEGLSIAVVYPSVMLGPGDWNGSNTPALWKLIYEGSRFYPKGSSGFVNVQDVAQAIKNVVTRDKDGERFLLSAENLSWKELMDSIARTLQVKAPYIALSAWQSALLWPIATIVAKSRNRIPLITRASHTNVQSNYRYDGNSYSEMTGISYTSIQQTIEETSQLFLHHVMETGRDE